jgi:hypothetical protein
LAFHNASFLPGAKFQLRRMRNPKALISAEGQASGGCGAEGLIAGSRKGRI